eukprot:5644271-Lingulodinium_polyedra.AAC.1
MIVHSEHAARVHAAVLANAGSSVARLEKERGVFVLPVQTAYSQDSALCPITEQEAQPQDASTEEAREAFSKLLPAVPSDEERRAHELTH